MWKKSKLEKVTKTILFLHCVQSGATDVKTMSSVAGTVASLSSSALSALPFVIVSAACPVIHLSASTLPVINIPQTGGSLKQQSYFQPSKESHVTVSRHSPPSAMVSDLSGLVRSNVSGTASDVGARMKSIPRLSRLNAIDLTVTSAADTEPAIPPSAAAFGDAQPAPSVVTSSRIADAEAVDTGDVDGVVPRRQIAPIPGAVCSAEKAARVGSSYLCSTCGKTFSSAPQLAVHRNIHFFERQFRCGVCRSSFVSRTSLEHHQVRKHHRVPPESAAISSDPRPFKCDECGVAFRIQGHLDKHKRSKVHAARLENSHDLLCPEDAEQSTAALALVVNNGDGSAAECDEDRREGHLQETSGFPANKHEEDADGELFVTCTVFHMIFGLNILLYDD